MFREGLAAILASYEGMEVVAEIPNDGEALRLARDLEPDVVVIQVQMPFERAKETLRRMHAFPRPPKVMIVTMFEDPRYLRELMGVGPAPTCLRAPPPSI
jgi:DNA-binding NarL/FixJ family response regulator